MSASFVRSPAESEMKALTLGDPYPVGASRRGIATCVDPPPAQLSWRPNRAETHGIGTQPPTADQGAESVDRLGPVTSRSLRNPDSPKALMERILGRSTVDPHKYGQKARNLDVLVEKGFNVPSAVAIPFTAASDFEIVDAERALQMLGTRPVYVIVRSSGLVEDSPEQSLAGHFESIRTQPSAAEVASAVRSVSRSGPAGMGCAVVVQVWIDPLYAGVAFSCDPVTFERLVVVNWVRGRSDDLLSGRLHGHQANQGERPPEFSKVAWAKLVNDVRRAAEVFDTPIDIEWCISGDDTIWLVQARPIILPAAGAYQLNSEDDFGIIPASLRLHRKILLRQAALNGHVPMARSTLHVATDSDRTAGSPGTVEPSSAATTVVLIAPDRIDGEIVREFAGTSGLLMDDTILACARYAIRRYPRFHDVGEAIVDTLSRGLSHHVVAAALEGQILHATWTGVFTPTNYGSVIELAQGHFVPKGLVETSQYQFDTSGILIDSREVFQSAAVHFVDGRVVEESPIAFQNHPTPDTITSIQQVLGTWTPHFPGAALEFGVLLNDPGDVRKVFLIDTVDLDASTLPAAPSSRLGAISIGSVRGVRVSLNDLKGSAHDAHFHNEPSGEPQNISAPTIYFVDSDSLAWLELVNRSDPRSTGFVFRRASLLSHLSIILRERGIPAAFVADTDSIYDGDLVELQVTHSAVSLKKVETPYLA